MPKKILILTVGGSHIPIVQAIQSINPDYVIFICINDIRGSKEQILGEGNPCEVRRGSEVIEKLPNIPTQVGLNSNFQLKLISQADDMVECYKASIESIITAKKLSPDAEIIASYTGGTKTMSAALAMAGSDYDVPIIGVSFSGKIKDSFSGERLRLQRLLSTESLKNKLPSKKINQAINALKVGNFKAFSDLQHIPLRPITLIYGANSSGKSSILHSLLLAHHAINNKGELDIYRTEAGGDSVDLGGFGQYIYKRDRTSQVQWAVDLDPQKLTLLDSGLSPDLGLMALLEDIKQLTVGVGIGTRASGKGPVRIRSFYLEADRESILTMSSRPQGKLQLDTLNLDHPVIKRLIQAIIDSETFSLNSTPEEFYTVINELVPNITAEAYDFFPRKLQLKENEALVSFPSNRPSDSPEDAVKTFFLYRLNQLIPSITRNIETEIKHLRYLGPFRTYPPRHFALSRQQDENWDSGGGYAWDILLKDAQVRQKVNDWLGDSDRMKSPYEIAVRYLLPTMELEKELPSIVNKELHDFLAFLIMGLNSRGYSNSLAEIERIADSIQSSTVNYDEPDAILPDIQEIINTTSDIDTAIETWINKLNEKISDKVSDLVLIDKRSDTVVSHRDVGIGISQVIPILVSCYGLSDSLVAIEQPEIHLHPKLQAELGDVFIESALGQQKNRFILETHSEHLLLRIMRRMRETYNNELPEGVLPITPEDVSIVFVETMPNKTIVRKMPLNQRGELVKAWPGGFFEEELDEIFESFKQVMLTSSCVTNEYYH
jgi:AAA15 family ATPase/GTPase